MTNRHLFSAGGGAALLAAAGVAAACVAVAAPDLVVGGLPGVSPEHVAGFLPLFFLPALWMWLGRSTTGAQVGRFRQGFVDAAVATRIVIVGLWVGAVVHLAIIPAHLSTDPTMAALFVLDGLGFVAVSVAATVAIRGWRIAALLLSLTTIGAYIWYIAAGMETADALGIVTTGAEAVSAAVIVAQWGLAPRATTSRRVAAVGLALTALIFAGGVASAGHDTVSDIPAAMTDNTTMTSPTGGSATADSMVASGGGMNSAPTGSAMSSSTGAMASSQGGAPCPNLPTAMPSGANGDLMQPVPSGPPTAQQSAAAQQLIAQTTAGVAQFADVNNAIAAGYRPGTNPNQAIVHYTNPNARQLLNPTLPQSLVYAHSNGKTVLLGAMYTTLKSCQPGPDLGGPLTQWHGHSDLCFSDANRQVVGHNNSGPCPAGSRNAVTPFMLHVWLVPTANGPFGMGIDHPAVVNALKSA